MPSSGTASPPAASTLWQGLSAEAVKGYASSTEAIEAAVRLIGEQLGLRTGWLNRIDCTAANAVVVAAYNAPGGCGVEAGGSLPLPDLY